MTPEPYWINTIWREIERASRDLDTDPLRRTKSQHPVWGVLAGMVLAFVLVGAFK